MMQVLAGRTRSLVATLWLLPALAAAPAGAVRVPDLYAESVPVADDSAGARQAAFAEALRRVLVKVSGRSATAGDAALLGRFADPAALVQQFRRDGAGMLWVQFDPVAVRRGLEAAGVPVWGDDRPLTAVWLAYDNGAGERDVLSGAGPDGSAAAALRQDVLRSAQARGAPVVLPLRDSQELAAVAFADVWGDFTAPVSAASARYQADAVLIGRARLFPPGMTDVRWTLLAGGERADWRGSVADGPQGLAERLSQRLAAGGGNPQLLRLAVSGISTLEQYGAVLAHLQGLDVTQSLAVARVDGDAVTFDLRLRGDREQLGRALAAGRLIEPVGEAAGEFSGADLRYRLAGIR